MQKDKVIEMKKKAIVNELYKMGVITKEQVPDYMEKGHIYLKLTLLKAMGLLKV